jgi:hypothetical protein
MDGQTANAPLSSQPKTTVVTDAALFSEASTHPLRRSSSIPFWANCIGPKKEETFNPHIEVAWMDGNDAAFLVFI